jgi:molybdate transport system ATP-binding protein
MVRAQACKEARLMGVLEVSVSGEAGEFRLEAGFEAGSGITALFGHSGAGKTTILKMIAGMSRPKTGRIVAGGRVLFDGGAGIDLPPQRRQVGFVFQDGRLFPHLSVRRNLTYARWAGKRRATRPFEEVVALLGLESHLDRSPATLSGGERQRVAIGRALLSDPAILLMDEPLSSLDQARRLEILPYIEAIRDETAIPIVYVSHEIDEVARLADTVVVLEQGRMLAAGPAAEIFGRLDLGDTLGRQEAGALVEGTVREVEPEYGVALIDVEGARLELVGEGFSAGEAIRLRIRARDVALAMREQPGLSIRNQLPCVVREIAIVDPAFVEIALELGAQRLRSRITRKSADEMGLAPGRQVVALLKAVSVERRVARHRRLKPPQ